jgi:cell division protein FtsN
LKRRYVWLAAAAAVLLSAVLVWTTRDSAVAVSTSRIADRPEAAPATAAPMTEPIAPAAPSPVAVAPPATQVPAVAEVNRFFVVVSSFRTRDRAAMVAADIVALGMPAFVRTTSSWQQVVVGPYASRPEATAAQSRLAAAHFPDTTIDEGTPPPRTP